jgi:putative hydrolase of the HAD superfamily
LDGVVSSAMVGAAKPAPALFEAALAAAGCSAADALHVGDSPSKDIDGASRAAIAAVLIDRNGEWPQAPARIESLAELPGLL